MKIFFQARLYFWSHNIIFHILWFAIVILIFALVLRYDRSYDITLNQLNSLAPASQNIIRQFTSPIKIKIFIRPEDKLATVIHHLLLRYQKEMPDIHWEFLDPLLHPDIVKQYQINMGDMVIINENRFEKIESISEEQLSNALQRLLHKKNQNIVFLTGHAEQDIYSREDSGYYLFYQQLIKQGLEVSTINLLQDWQWPKSMALLIIAGPKQNFSSGEVNKIIAWLKQGGRLLWLQDPLSDNSDFKDLLNYLDIEILPGTIVDNNPDIKDFIGLPKHPALIPVVEGTPHIISHKIKSYTLFPFACGLDIHPTENTQWNKQALVRSLDRTWAEVEPLSGTLFLDQADIEGPLDIGVAIEAADKAKMVVFCDSDFLNNRYVGMGDNLLLGLNSIYWLLEKEAFINISAKFSQDKELLLTEKQLIILSILFLIGLPSLFFLLGTGIWWWRKRQ